MIDMVKNARLGVKKKHLCQEMLWC